MPPASTPPNLRDFDGLSPPSSPSEFPGEYSGRLRACRGVGAGGRGCAGGMSVSVSLLLLELLLLLLLELAASSSGACVVISGVSCFSFFPRVSGSCSSPFSRSFHASL